MRPLRILIWHVHGSYLYYLTQTGHQFYLPSRTDRSGDYVGKWGHFPWGANVHDVPEDQIRNLDLDCVVYQRPRQFFEERARLLSDEQQSLPAIYIEHDPPLAHPTDNRHPVDDTETLLVHVTPFNRLMWDSGRTPTRVIEHGVFLPDAPAWTGELERGIAVVNNPATRGRRLGPDIYERAARRLPLDIIGMGADRMPGGKPEVLHHRLPGFLTHYRFSFNPIRYTSLGLAVCEALMLGLPVIGLATTEMATVIQNGVNGYAHTDPDKLISFAERLLADRELAAVLSEGAKRTARERFNISRFIREWNEAFGTVTGSRRALVEAGTAR